MRRGFLLSIVAVVLFPSLLLAMANIPQQEQSLSVIGKQAYDVTLPTSDGQQKTIGDMRGGKKAMLFFWATWCPNCHVEIKRLNDSIDDIRAKGIEPILINAGETPAEAKNYLERKKINLISLVDEENILQEPYELIGVPTIFFVDQAGIIRHVEHEIPADYENYFN